MKKAKLVKLFIGGGIIVSAFLLCKKVWSGYEKVLESCAKFRTYFRILDKWLKIKEKQGILENYFLEEQFYKIAIYGIGVMGRHLFEELKNGKEIKVLYAIDRNADQIDFSVNVLKLNDTLPDVDAVIVTAVCEFDEIKETLSEKIKCPILSLEDVVNDVWEEIPA